MHPLIIRQCYDEYMTKTQRLVILISIFASFLPFLDSSVVNVALPAIVDELGGGLSTQQWVSSAYLITLGSLILVAGSLSDIFGRKRILLWGVIGFGVSSILCAVAITAPMLILMRGLQGIFGALLVPSSLALIISTFSGSAQAKAIGTWTAWTGVAFVVGPLVGGLLVDALWWRGIFVINIIPTLATLWLLRSLPEDKHHEKTPVDVIGALLCTVGLAGAVYALIEQPIYGWQSPMISLPLIASVALFGIFILYERSTKHPMLPLSLFAVRNFSVGNIATTAIYAGLSVATFLITIFIQQVGHYSAFEAGLSLLPITIIMFFLSSRFGALAGKYGPRFFMATGPLVAAIGFALLLGLDQHVNYWTELFPAIATFGLGLSMTVAPLTAAVLGTIDSRNAGIASAINNAVARIAGLVAVAAIGLVTGSVLDVDGFHRGVWLMVILLTIGGIISAIGIKNPAKDRASE